jgi:hypothetical protein
VLSGIVVSANEFLTAAKTDPFTTSYPEVLQGLVDQINTLSLFSPWKPIANTIAQQATKFALDGTVAILLMRSGQDEHSGPALTDFLDNVRDRAQELLDQVAGRSDLDEDLQTLLVERLGDIVVAVAEARSGRFDRLRSSAAAGVGQMAVRPDLPEQARKHPVLATVLNLLTYLSLAAAPLGVAADTVSLNEALNHGAQIEMVVIEAPPLGMRALPRAPAELPPGADPGDAAPSATEPQDDAPDAD